LDDAAHLQTLTIPQLRTGAHRQSDDGGKKKKGLFGKKKEASAPAGCDPDVFAEEIAAQLSRASEIRNRPRVVRAKRITEPKPAEPLVEPAIDELFANNQPAGQSETAGRTLSWPKPGEVPVQR